MRSRTFMIALIVTVTLGALTLAACGDGSRPAPIVSTVLPSPASSEPVTLSPTPGGATTSPGATTDPTATATPGGEGGGGQGATITDASIRASILSRLAQAPELNGLRFKVNVRDRIVILRGVVKTAAQKTAAEQVAVTEPGIVKVLSYVFVEPEGDGGY